MRRDIDDILNYHGSEVEGYLLTEEEFISACQEAVEKGLVEVEHECAVCAERGDYESPAEKHDFSFDMYGRIFMDGEHVGWARKAADPYAIGMLAEKLCYCSTAPVLVDMVEVKEINEEEED